MTYKFDPKLDLVLERKVDLTPEKIWQAWTTPQLLQQWFCPAPWKVTKSEMDVAPGGIFSTTMQSPEGEEFPNLGCILEAIENEKLVWTSCLLPGFRPVTKPVSGADMYFTGMLILKPEGKGTLYKAYALHGNEEDRNRHEQMGFQEGWGICLDQLIALQKK